ncbi:hypothetical protein PLESTB_000654400 [Pleodorina starrii]|uniref:ShKT domain-containing protein n=1 Tax=Pleodorina starrii TaxID=330485 RepID=A0A9W6BIE2_9CHLO|nr:hypothetical protein PLESTB_000654400 [Pleodorina starrii]GLC71667.1 hypothetical protein PLESTF_001147300 [Pleodorina starrii]
MLAVAAQMLQLHRLALSKAMKQLHFLLLTAAVIAYLFDSVAGNNRDDAFIGYSERLECLDRLDHCGDRARHARCLTDPYNMRTFCPISCAVSKCMSTGTLKVRHVGFATEEDTLVFAQRWAARSTGEQAYLHLNNTHPNFRRRSIVGSPLTLSSLGVGTYLGDLDSRTDDAVAAAVIHSVVNGWNVIDTASNYRWGRAESSIGAALDSLLAGAATRDFLAEQQYFSDVTRSMLFISTKAGFTDEALVRELVQAKQLDRRAASGGHSMAPAYLVASLNASLARLNLQTVDLLYLHNAAEMQLKQLGWPAFRVKLKEAFEAFESLRAAGSIRSYGMATWDCFRVPPSDPGHVNLEEVVAVAKEAAGGGPSGFAAVQLPISASMPEAWLQPWQRVDNESVTLMRAAERLGVAVFTSGPLGEGELLKRLTSHLDPVVQLRAQSTTAQKLLQLARSTPGHSMASTLVGHKTREYVEANTALAGQAPLKEPEFQEAMLHVKAILGGGDGAASTR